MSEVKPVHRYKAQTLFSLGGTKIEYFPHGPEVVLATEFDAQRLRADTAEAERDALREALLIYSGQHERSSQVGHVEMLDIAQSALNGCTHKIDRSAKQVVAWAVTLNGQFNSNWISAGSSKSAAEGMRDNYISRCRPCDLPKLELVPLLAALNPNPEAESHE